MSQRVGQYQITEPDTDPVLLEEALEFFRNKGKAKVYSYGKGQVCFHHRKAYWFVSNETKKYAPRHRSNERWYRADSLEEIWDGINAWCDYRDNKRKGSEE